MERRVPPVCLESAALGVLMPMHVVLDPAGRIIACGQTMQKLFGQRSLPGADFFALFDLRRPSGLTGMASLRSRVGQRIYLIARDLPTTGLRGVALPLAGNQGMVLNLSFGIGLIDAVGEHDLTDADFAPTDLAIELLYVVEAKSAVMQELKDLNLRLHGAKVAAEEQALTDTLTGLRNRRALDLALQRALHGGGSFALMHLDLDFFKAVNDTLGHAAGDHVLRCVAEVLSGETRQSDTVARVGGDEFVILLPGLADPTRLMVIAQRIVLRLSEPILYEGRDCVISASIGLAVSSSYEAPTADEMFNDADQALYAAKHAGRGCVRLHAPPITSNMP
ncbi:diguanylate cyclase (GGDEF) domain-containing protein [Gemmobacter aquatilis]|uniref:Diguanylate cyclase (GGDEF) domain-containing protein n=1 Tax=Gemmobacter aquatilis TaxID=933059 RepID=A0A1H8HVI5_9RHOB|nr:GGDEF domain-containing protein [Gemmobacter aquatilis]SEN59995.1 diguanylate cyclase (GGDEF) domain-containing protein [Gemmobacter aquatilis]